MRPGRRVIAIDGPAASGKSTTAAAVAARLGFVHLNSGLLYRALTWKSVAEGWSPSDDGYDARIRGLRIELRGQGRTLVVLVDDDDPGDALHGRAVAAGVSEVAGVAAVREVVLARLRAAGAEFDLVCDGRDIGTTVFPEADLKIFLIADPGERARRRLLDLGEEPSPAAVREETARLERRDAADSARELSPLRRAPDAVVIDTTGSPPEAVVERICDLAARRGIVGGSTTS
ncbi:MAG: (d)CMP kinase [Gemmatimonadota bacterium]|nr:(d)CMP kinase [Gemmatimonadota bacterium]